MSQKFNLCLQVKFCDNFAKILRKAKDVHNSLKDLM